MFQRSLCAFVFLCILVVPFAAQQKPGLIKVPADSSTAGSGAIRRDGRIVLSVDWPKLVQGTQPASPNSPKLSHDAQQLAYLSGNSLHVVPATGGPSKVVYEHPPNLVMGDWTADSSALIVKQGSEDGQEELGIVDIAKGTFRRVAPGAGVSGISTAATQPWVVYAQWIPGALSRSELRILSMKDERVSVLLTGADDFSPVWSPKDDAVIFESNRDGRRGLWSIEVRAGRAAGKPRLLHELSEDLSSIGIAPDGTAYFEGYSGSFTTYIAHVTWPGGEVSAPTAISTPRFLGARRPMFSPDGKSLATVLRTAAGGVRPGWQTPAVTELANGGQRTFPSELTIRDEVGWFPDGHSLLAIDDESVTLGKIGLPCAFWRLSLPDKSSKRLGQARGPGSVRLSGITDREIVYRRTVFSPPAYYIEAFDLKTGATRELYRSDIGEITDASLSSDGKQLAMAIRRPGSANIFLLRVGESTPTKVMLSGFSGNGRPQVMWGVTQDSVILSGTIGQERGIWRVPTNGDAPLRLKLNVQPMESRLSPDGQTLAYTTQAPQTRELWMLKNAVK